MSFVPRVNVPVHLYRPAWIVPRDELVDFTHVPTIPFYPRVKGLLKTAFKCNSFLPRQVAAINCAIRGFDLFLLLPTCGGKSLCYQLPAIFNESAITVVFSPFTALIEDQMRALHALGPKWETWAQRSHTGYRQDLSFIESQGLRIFYVCPEWLENDAHKQTLYDLARQDKIGRIVIDEAHNAITALQNTENPYRRAYKTVFSLRASFPTIPFTLSSASLTIADQNTLASALLARGQFYSVSSPSFRYEHHYRVVHIKRHRRAEQKIAIIAQYMNMHRKGKGFVFVPTKKLARKVAEKLKERGIQAEWYHSGEADRLPDIMRRLNAGLIPVLVCTSAFGEGIDNKHADFVFHYSIPPSMTRYFQETGRIGRDGQRAECILLYSFSDIRLLANVVAHDLPPTRSKSHSRREFSPSQRAELQEVLEYCLDSFSCRQRRILFLFNPPCHHAFADKKSTNAIASRLAEYHKGAMQHTYGGGPIIDGSYPIDKNCGACDVCQRRYLPYNEEELNEDEMSWWSDVLETEMEQVESGFQNDMSLLLPELVKRVVAKGLERKRAQEVVELLAVSGVLRMVFEYAGFGIKAGFRIKLEKGPTKFDWVPFPVPVPWRSLGPVKIPTQKRKVHQRIITDDSIDLDSNADWKPDSEDTSSSEDDETDSEDDCWTSTSEDELEAIPFEDGHGLRRLRPRKRERSPSFELPDPPPPAQRLDFRPHSRSDDMVLSSPSKRRRVETESDIVNQPTDAGRLLKKYQAAARKERKADAEELLSVSEKTLRGIFTMHTRIMDKMGFSAVLKQVRARPDEVTILNEWYEWIESEVFAGRLDMSSTRR